MGKLMNLKELQDSNRIIYKVISGSHAYGIANKDSDIDIRGFFVHDPKAYLNVFNEPEPQISDEKHDITYYSIKKAFELLSKSNPNIIELLWMPDDCIRHKNQIMDAILENRHLFISKACFDTHSGYAFAQIKKAKGSNKKVHNPQPKERPVKENFCRVILLENINTTPKQLILSRYGPSKYNEWTYKGLYPFRPVPLKDVDIDLSKHHVAGLEHAPSVYRLYEYGSEAKGVFRGDDMLVTESIPKEDEWNRIVGLLIYNKDEYDRALKDWHSYWDWMKFRNSSRWIDQEKGNLDYDQKNMTHCVRLLMSGENILRNGEPIVRFEGKQLEYLLNIRKGKLKYEAIVEDVEKRMKLLQQLKKVSTLPDDVDT
ncbi:MAG: nucleotidyltransferase domain-containing protein, partial [Thermoplasmatales archaeon]